MYQDREVNYIIKVNFKWIKPANVKNSFNSKRLHNSVILCNSSSQALQLNCIKRLLVKQLFLKLDDKG